MPRSGRCRCGQLLRFEMTARGYKTRCPRCHAIVRLRDPSEPLGPTAARAEALAATMDYTAPDDLLALGERQTDAPVALAEMPAYAGPGAGAPPQAWRRWLLPAAVLAVLLTVGAVTALLGL